MNWKWIGILSTVSLLSALLTVFGAMPEGAIAYVVGLGLALGISFLFAKVTDDKFFRNGFTLGVVGGLVSTLVQMMFFNTMVENNPQMAARFEQMPNNMNPVIMFAIFAPIGILISGAIQGLFTWVIAMLIGKGSKRRPVPPPAV